MPAPNRPTGHLFTLASCKRTPDLSLVQQLVQDGAVVNWQPQPEQPPLLRLLARHGHIGALIACLETEKDIDFTPSDVNDLTLFDALCAPHFLVDDAVRVLEACVRHIELHPRDTVTWEGFLQRAALHGRLSCFYKVVQDMPYYGDRTEKDEKIYLPPVETEDWAAMPEEDKKLFDVAPPANPFWDPVFGYDDYEVSNLSF